MYKHSGGISKGAEASPQPKQTNTDQTYRCIRRLYSSTTNSCYCHLYIQLNIQWSTVTVSVFNLTLKVICLTWNYRGLLILLRYLTSFSNVWPAIILPNDDSAWPGRRLWFGLDLWARWDDGFRVQIYHGLPLHWRTWSRPQWWQEAYDGIVPVKMFLPNPNTSWCGHRFSQELAGNYYKQIGTNVAQYMFV